MKRKKFLLLSFIFLSYVPVLAQVDTAWVRRYNGPVNLFDQTTDLTVDGNGNVYVTGWSHGGFSSYDYATIKYAPNGETLWVRKYNGLSNSDDIPYALAVDGSGNVYVSGYSRGGQNYYTDYATVKYAPNGETLWVRRYDGPGNIDDVAHALVVDGIGNVYVTGGSWGSGTFEDYATVKYAPNGDTLWVRRYNGPGNSDDVAYAMTLDKDGNVYVTGQSVGSGTSSDYLTIKYGPNGDSMWVRRYNGPGNAFDRPYALVLDSSGNLYVTGASRSDTSDDYATIKYAPNGDTIWVRRYDGSVNGNDFALDLALDGSALYVVGQSDGGASRYDYLTIKYTPDGDTLWVRRFNGPENNFDWAYALAVDSIGNVYVTGATWNDGLGSYDKTYDYATIKYSPDGDLLWTMQYNGPGDSSDFPGNIVVNKERNVYVAGYSKGSGTDYDFCTIKYVQCFAKSGDATGDGNVNLSDIVFMVNYIFKDGSKPEPICRGDDTGNSSVNLADIIYKVNYIFKGGPAPVKSDICCL